MKLQNIREMNDRELYTFINNISNNNGRICCKCGNIEKIRRAIECPQFGNENYGEWGTLNLEQRKYIRKLLFDLTTTNNFVKDLYFENEKLKENWNKLKEYIRKNIIYDDVGMKILDPSPLEDYIQELEQGSDE